ncbi:hypothetical protein SVA_1753 [Sulfurifustis variabilis]|uniref:histidine kinase n=1 Tax=Sulfurifustis variabilis TaxID=1675686 RepID=A0A1B4VDM1_9GAMM|nr:PAS domain S-box protein [Sulfurifustis variabilis]BAU48307.1 hypothetical protein SVA_1753 [Sulfurifustis variabilis]
MSLPKQQAATRATAFAEGERVLVLAPTGRDALLVCTFLAQAGIPSKSCDDMSQLCEELDQPTGATLIAEEALGGTSLRRFTEALAQQPPWSDLPILILTNGGEDGGWRRLAILDSIGNATLIERPVRMVHLMSAVQTALRSRRRQYEMRAYLAERETRERAAREAARLEQALRAQATAAREDLERVVASIRDGFMIVDRAWRFTYVNEQAARFAGLRPADMLAKSLWELFPDRIGGKFYHEAQRAMTQRQALSFDLYHPAAHRWFEYRLYPQPQGLVILETDVTDRKQAEEHRAQLAAVVEASANAITSQTLEGIITSWNPGAERMYGYTADEAVGRSIYMTIPPELTEEMAELYARVRTGGRVERAESVRQRKDGTTLPVAVSLAPIRGRDGMVVALTSVETDIAERVRVEQALRDSEDRYRRLIELSPAAVFVHLENRIVYANPASLHLFGAREPNEVLGHSKIEFVHPDFVPIVEGRIRRMRETGEPNAPMEQKWVRRDGTVIDVEVSASPLPWSGRTAVQVIARDITLRKRAENALRDSEMRERARALEIRSLMEAVPAAVLIAEDIECRRITANRAGYDLLRLPVGSNTSLSADVDAPRHFRVFTDGRELRPEELPVQRAAATGTPIRDVEEEIVFDDGSRVFLLGNAVPLFDETGRPRGAVAAFVDITARKQAEEAVRASEARFRHIFQSAAVAIFEDDFLPAWEMLQALKREGVTDFRTYFREHPDAVQRAAELVRVNEANREGCEIWQAEDRQDLLGPLVRLFGAESAPALERCLVQLADGADYIEEEAVIRTLKGELREVRCAVALHSHEPDDLRRVLVTSIDITAHKHAERALRASEARYRYIFEAAAPGIIEVDASHLKRLLDGLKTKGPHTLEERLMRSDDFLRQAAAWLRVVAANPQAIALYEADDIEALNPLARLFEPSTLRIFGECVEQIAEGVRYYEGEGSILTVKGNRREVFLTVSLPTQPQDFRRVLVTLMDMTERKRAEESVRRSEANLAKAQAIAHVGSWEWEIERNDITCSDETYRILGLEPQSREMRFPNIVEAVVHPDDRERVKEIISAALRQPHPWFLEIRLVLPDGSERVAYLRAEVVCEGDRPVRMVGTLQDITERKLVEEALRFSESRFRAALQGVPIVVSQQDRELRYTWIHKPLPGYTVDRVIGRRDTDVLERREEAEALEAFKRHVIHTGVAARRKFRLHLEGAPRELDVIAEPLRSGHGDVVGVTCAAVDITEHTELQDQLRRQAEQLARMDSRKNEFLAMLAHELRNPLAPIHNAVHVLKIQPDPPDRRHLQWALDVIARQVQHLARLVDDLLDIARITHGRIRLQRELVDLHTLLAQAVEAARPTMTQRRHALVYAPPSEPIVLEADPTRLVQIVGNLLGNAGRYTPPGGRIDVAARREGSEAVITVRDNGIGIAAEALPHIFDLFSQAGRSTDDRQGGLGLGLALVHRLVELHGGSVSAASAGTGKGSTFTVRLPVLPEAREAPAGYPAQQPVRDRRGMRILVVDDNPDVAQSLAVLLDVLGHRVEAVNDGGSVLPAIERCNPDVVFLDIGLPDMDGYEVARRIRAAYPTRALRVVALTGYGQEEVRRRVQSAGFDAHLLKPASVESLETLLASFRLQ